VTGAGSVRVPMRRIIVLNQKGGVGKTTTVANLGACLAELGRTVLMVDVDPQANLSLHYGVDVPRGGPSLYTLIRGEHTPAEVLQSTCVEGLHLLPSNIDLAGLPVEMADSPGRLFAVRRTLDALPMRFDYVLMDSAPSLGLLTLNAACAAQEVFIALQAEFFALQGVGKLVRTIRRVRRSVNPALRISGVVVCMYDARTRLAKETLEEVRRHFGRRVFEVLIRQNVRLAEAPGFGLPVIRYDPDCHGARDYRRLAREVVAMEAAVRASPPSRARPDTPRSMAG